MIKNIFLVAFIFLISHSPSYAEAKSGGIYSEDLAYEREKLGGYIKSLHQLIANSNNNAIIKAQNKVNFSISDKPIPNAWVESTSSGNYIIQITATHRLLATYITDTDVIASIDASFLNCRQLYIEHLFGHMADNGRRIAKDLSPLKIPAPEVFFNASYQCKKYVGQFPIDQKYRQARDIITNVIMALAYFHELGHVALNHRRVNMDSIDESAPMNEQLKQFVSLMSRSRQQEYEADNWATARFVELSNNPLEMFNNAVASFYLAFGAVDCSLESGDSHPNGFQRYSRMINLMKEKSIASGKLQDNNKITDLINDFKKVALKAQEKLQCPSY